MSPSTLSPRVLERQPELAREIRLPLSSATRRSPGYIKLLESVAPDADSGFGFEGQLLKAGTWIAEEDLRPKPSFPRVPVLLEYAVGNAAGIPGRKRCEQIYILWRWDARAYEWRELGRAVSATWDWAVVLRPLAIRALAEARRNLILVEKATDFQAINARISDYIDHELAELKPPERRRALVALHDQFAARLCA